MMRSLILLALFCTAASANKILDMVVDEGVLINWANHGSYALGADELLKDLDWASVDVNGDKVHFVTQDCKSIETTTTGLGDRASKILNSVVDRLRAPNSRNTVSFFNLDCHIKGEDIDSNLFYHGDVVVERINNNHLTVSVPCLTKAGFERVAINGELITFVHADGSFEIHPLSCLDAAKKSLMEEMHKEINDAKEDERAAMRQKSGRV